MGWNKVTPPGNNPSVMYEIKINPIKVWTSETATFNIVFV
jgi:hypothetical protein